jgi:branched-chain amino acid transport system substrate-binding protein
VQRYLNERKVPQMFLFTGTSRFRDPQHYPWTMGGDLSFVSETRGFAKFILKEKPDAKIAVLYQNDDYGKDHLNTLKAALGDKAKTMIVAEASYEVTDPTVDSQVVALKASGADTLLDVALPKFAAQAIRKVAEVGWHPLHIVPYPASSIPLVMQPARARPFGRRRHRRVSEGAGRPGLAGRPGSARLSRFHEELQFRCRPERLVERDRLITWHPRS